MTADNNSAKNKKRKRGAQPGNINALRHGFYSRQFKPSEAQDLEKTLSEGLHDEIAMLRVATRRAFELANQADDIDQAIKALGALGLASIRTSRLLKSQKELGNGDQALSAVSTAISEVLKERGWE